ncbi:hypothetical protein ACJX0J_022315, partial [Zea mays]
VISARKGVSWNAYHLYGMAKRIRFHVISSKASMNKNKMSQSENWYGKIIVFLFFFFIIHDCIHLLLSVRKTLKPIYMLLGDQYKHEHGVTRLVYVSGYNNSVILQDEIFFIA